MEQGSLMLKVEFHTSEDQPGVWIGSCPEIDLATQGYTLDEARSNLQEALITWLSFCLENGTLEEALRECSLEAIRAAQIAQSIQQVTPTKAVQECLA